MTFPHQLCPKRDLLAIYNSIIIIIIIIIIIFLSYVYHWFIAASFFPSLLLHVETGIHVHVQVPTWEELYATKPKRPLKGIIIIINALVHVKRQETQLGRK